MSVHRPEDPRHNGARILATAEGILIALRRYTMAKAIGELAQTARTHNLPPLSLANALVVAAENQSTQDLDPHTAEVVHNTWGSLLGLQPAPQHSMNG